MKEKLQKMLAKKEQRKADLLKQVNETEDVKQLRSINTELETLNSEIAEVRSMIEAIPDEPPAPPAAPKPAAGKEGEQRGQQEPDKDPKVDKDPEKRGQQDPPDNPEGNPGEQRSAGPVGQTQILNTFAIGTGALGADEQRAYKEKCEKRGKDLKEGKAVLYDLDEVPEFRAINVTGGTLVVPTHQKKTLAEPFSEVSSLIDVVKAVPLPGGEAYEVGFIKGWGEGDYKGETADYEETDPEMDYVSTGKAKITAYTEITDEARKLPAINYQDVARRNVLISLRKKIAKQLIAGAGGANAITGIFNSNVKVIPAASDIEIAEIDADTLDKIVFGYGGDEDVEGGAYLILSKKDLAAFAAVRSSDGEKKLYKITINGNTGTISSDGSYAVNFIINSACPALSAEATNVDTYCMAYGVPQIYEMPIFSPVEIAESREYKFRSGQIAFRGVVWVGGTVAAYKGFCRVKKVAAA